MNTDIYHQEVRFSDIDAMGHVNNAVYLSYFEQARIHFFKGLRGEKLDWEKNGIILAKNIINYYIPILLGDQVEIHVHKGKLGTKSFELEYKLYKREGEKLTLCTDGISVLVCFDHVANTTMAIPDSWRAFLKA